MSADEKIGMLWDKFREGATEAGKDPEVMKTQLQVHVSWASSQQVAEEQAVREWPNGGMPFPKTLMNNCASRSLPSLIRGWAGAP